MAQKVKSIKIEFTYPCPITTTYALLCLLFFTIDAIADRPITQALFTTCGSSSSSLPFSLTNLTCYLRLIPHIFTYSSIKTIETFIFNLIFILFIGSIIESDYKALLILMIVLTAFLTGILGAIFSTSFIRGAEDVAILMLLLLVFSYILGLKSGSAKKISASVILIFVLYLVRILVNLFLLHNSVFLIYLASALASSSLVFLNFTKKESVSKGKAATPAPNSLQ